MQEPLEKNLTNDALPNEKQLRRYLDSEAEAIGHGGIELISKISGKSGNTIVAGIKENKKPKRNLPKQNPQTRRR